MKKRDIVILVVGVSALVLTIIFKSVAGVSALRAFGKSEDWHDIKGWFKDRGHDITHFSFSDFNSEYVKIDNSGIHIVDGDDIISIDKEGIFVGDDDDKVVVDKNGVVVKNDDTDVTIDKTGVHVDETEATEN